MVSMNIASIMKRKSVRNYDGEPINALELGKLRSYIDELNNTPGVFGNRIRLSYIERNNDNARLGTYGVIKGATSYMATACKKATYSMEDSGYQFEKMVLFATFLGLATVCLGGTFRRGGFAKAMGLQEDEIIPIVSPVGYEGGKKSLLGRLIKSNAGNRKPNRELFFDTNFNTPLSINDDFADVLEAVRQAPSALNAQPWRIIKDGDACWHFYSAGKSSMNRIDMGISLCHFEIATMEKGYSGHFQVLEQRHDEEKLKYLVSWIGD